MWFSRSTILLVPLGLSVLVFSGCITEPKVPSSLQVPADQKVFFHAYAKGVQIYVCESSATDSGKFAWKLNAPEAMLFDAEGNTVGSHFAGPTWQCDRDGSKVTGELLQRSAAPLANAVPWLLLKAKPSNLPGFFHDVTYIQRVNTTGGLAPAIAPTQAAQEVRVLYTAEYYFYRESRH